MMSNKLFIAGTDTNVGKTYVTVGVLNAFKNNKYSTLGIKPIATGCERIHGHLQNQDALDLQAASSIQLHYHQINPFALEPPVSPNIAARQIAREITVQELKLKTQYAIQYPADICLIEGVGGWYVPINQKETMADFVKALDLRVILVVGIRLGCINHTLLTYKAMMNDKVPLLGWIANCVDPKLPAREDAINTLKDWLPIPCLGVVDYKGKVETSILMEQLFS